MVILCFCVIFLSGCVFGALLQKDVHITEGPNKAVKIDNWNYE